MTCTIQHTIVGYTKLLKINTIHSIIYVQRYTVGVALNDIATIDSHFCDFIAYK